MQMFEADGSARAAAHIVVADPHDADRAAVCNLLRGEKNFQIDEATGVEELMKLVATRDIDCIIYDAAIGHESSALVHTGILATCPDPPASIMLTRGGGEQAVIRAFRHGFSDYVRKESLNPRELIGVVLRAVSRRRKETSQRVELDRLAALSLLDRQTGLPNRHFLEERLSILMASAERHQSEFAIFAIDIDEFKDINDVFGPAVGDQVLKEVARRLRKVSRLSDTLGRSGGDEFLYLMDRGVSPEAVASARNRIQDALSFSLEFEDVGLSLSSSVGVAIYPTDGLTAPDMLKAVDRSLNIDRASRRRPRQVLLRPHKVVSPDTNTLTDEAMPEDALAAPSCDVTFQTVEGSLAVVGTAAADPVPDRPALFGGRAEGDAESASILPETPGLLGVGGAQRTANRRFERRQRVLKRGTIVLNDGFSTINCVIRDLSLHGARIAVEVEYVAPSAFALVIVETGARFAAERRWQRGKDIGASFSS